MGFVILIVVLVIGSIIFNRLNGPLTDDNDIVNVILILAVIVAAISLISGFRVYNSRIRETASECVHLPDKLNRHRSILSIFLVICFFPIFICFMGFVITGNFYLFVILAMCFGAIIIKAPTHARTVSELNLNKTDMSELGFLDQK
jgi:O-antigen/teichoic acid export membrane protein